MCYAIQIGLYHAHLKIKRSDKTWAVLDLPSFIKRYSAFLWHGFLIWLQVNKFRSDEDYLNYHSEV